MGVAPCVKCVSDSAITTMALAAAGMGVALVPASTLAGADFSGLEQREIAGFRRLSSEIAAVYRSEAELAPRRRGSFWQSCRIAGMIRLLKLAKCSGGMSHVVLNL